VKDNSMKAGLTIGLLGLVLLAGCDESGAGPRFQGRVVSHVGTYGSGTGGQSNLDREGSMTSGFSYTDSSEPDWTSDIKWRFLRRDGSSDVYRVEWTFRLEDGVGRTEAKEVSFDGMKSVRVFGNQWQVVSLEPGAMKVNSQQAPST
jgi:hypothetical protein